MTKKTEPTIPDPQPKQADTLALGELAEELDRRAAACAKLAEGYREDGGVDDEAAAVRCGGKSAAYAHAAELVRQFAEGRATLKALEAANG